MTIDNCPHCGRDATWNGERCDSDHCPSRDLLSPRRIVLLYQAGIANVYEVKSFNLSDYGREAKRLLQSDFYTCETIARGMAAMGAVVVSAHCNRAGDVTHAKWSEDLSAAPFYASMHPVTENTIGNV